MPGTTQGAIKAARTNIERHGEDFYSVIGQLGGKAPYKGLKGYASNPALASLCGKKGGKISKRKSSKEKFKAQLKASILADPQPVYKSRLKRLLHLNK